MAVASRKKSPARALMTNSCANRCRRRRKEALSRSCSGVCASHCTETPYVVSYNTLGQGLSLAVSPSPGPRHLSVQPRVALVRQHFTKPDASHVQANLKQGESKGKAGGEQGESRGRPLPLLSPCSPPALNTPVPGFRLLGGWGVVFRCFWWNGMRGGAWQDWGLRPLTLDRHCSKALRHGQPERLE